MVWMLVGNDIKDERRLLGILFGRMAGQDVQAVDERNL